MKKTKPTAKKAEPRVQGDATEDELIKEEELLKEKEQSFTDNKETESLSSLSREKFEPRKKNLHRYSGHAVDMELRTRKDTPEEANIFDMLLSPQKRNELAISDNVTKELVNNRGIGIKLSPKAEELIDNITDLIEEYGKNGSIYQKGVPVVQSKTWDDNRETRAGLFTLSQILGVSNVEGNRIGGKNIEEAKRILFELYTDSSNWFTIKYERYVTSKDGVKDKYTITEYAPILKISKFEKERTDKNGILRKMGELYIITLNPIYFDQLEGYYVKRDPKDYITMKQAKMLISNVKRCQLGGIDLKLYKYLLKRKSLKEMNKIVKERSLFPVLAESYYRSKRISKIRKELDSTIKMMVKAGMLISGKRETDETGESVYHFIINPDWAS
jgi:hypothetical protein